MSAQMSRRAALCSVMVTVLGAAALSGCGAGGTGIGVPASSSVDLAKGKQLFTATCGSCHALEDAGTTGKIGPNLDDAYAADRIVGMEDSSFEALVRQQIDLADPPMPRHLLKGQDADDVAAYVASVAGVKLAQQYDPGSSPP
jgi:mono/diheme cytochrome c family protein